MDPVPLQAPQLLSKELIDGSNDSDWRIAKQQDLLYMKTDKGTVIIELIPEFAPQHSLNIKQMAENSYWDGQSISRVQDNYVVQWGGENKARNKNVKAKLKGEYFSTHINKNLISPLGDRDVYAENVGFYKGFPVAHAGNKTWLTHCYGAVGAGRDEAFDSGNGSELYVVIGHSPRHLDLNITLVGFVRKGIEILSSMRRGKGPMGFYKDDKKGAKIISIRMGTQLTKKDQQSVKVLRTDTPLFKKLIAARKNRQESWFHYRGDHVSLCNTPLPVR